MSSEKKKNLKHLYIFQDKEKWIQKNIHLLILWEYSKSVEKFVIFGTQQG